MTTTKIEPFNYEILRTIIGWIAISIAIICSITYFSYTNIPAALNAVPTSISVSFHFGSIIPFVGLLFVVSAFLFAFNGAGKLQFWLSKLAATCAAFVAIFPTSINFEWVMQNSKLQVLLPTICLEKLAQNPKLETCNIYDWDFTPTLHIGSAILLIAVLFVFCIIFLVRTYRKIQVRKSHSIRLKIRATLYLLSALAMVLSVVIAWLFRDENNINDASLFWVEVTCLVAFGISWLVAGKKLPGIAYTQSVEAGLNMQIDKPITKKPPSDGT